MRKIGWALAGATALLIAAACSDRTAITDAGRDLAPRGPSRTTSVTGAAFTTTNIHDDLNPTPSDHDLCQNATDDANANNCNLYFAKNYVWLSGGPSTAYVGNGSYFFAVLNPGGQADPNDGATDNLSDGLNGDHTTRTYTVTDGVIAYSGPHDKDGNLIRLANYDDTDNPGGVYILAVCSLENGYPVHAKDCKYDAFKVRSGACNPSTDPTCQPDNKAEVLTADKGAEGKYKNTYTWGISKAVDKTRVEQVGGQVTFTYTVTITHDGGTIGDVKVTGTIHVLNPNSAGVAIDGVTDALSGGTTCTVTNGGSQTIAANSITDFDYSCDLGSTVPTTSQDNTATITWSSQDLTNGKHLDGGSAHAFVEAIAFTETVVDGSVTVYDIFNNATPPGQLIGTVSSTDLSPKDLTSYTQTVNVPQFGCVSYDNTAKFTTNTSGTTGSSGKTVTVCGPARTGALTIGFWKGPNGNSLITNYCTPAATTSLADYLSKLNGADALSGPFTDAAGKTCAQLVTYVNAIIGAASATDMNKMLKAQMLATALDVYFSSFGYSTVGTSSGKTAIKPPSNFLPNGGIASFVMDLKSICPMVDNLSTGVAACKNGTPSTDAFAANAVPWASKAISGILTFAANLVANGGAFTGTAASSSWYGTDRTKQEILKNIFDQINNQQAFAAP